MSISPVYFTDIVSVAANQFLLRSYFYSLHRSFQTLCCTHMGVCDYALVSFYPEFTYDITILCPVFSSSICFHVVHVYGVVPHVFR